MFVMRLNPDGQPDPAFGNTGLTEPVFSFQDTAAAVALQPDGRIVTAGTTTVHGSADFLVTRLLPDGTLDKSYGQSSGASAPDFGGTEFGEALALAPDGKIVAAGSGTQPGTGTERLLVARFLNPEGFLDTSYGATSGASRPIAFPGSQRGNAVALQADGKILVAGTQTVGSDKNFIVARFLNPEGTSDPAFGQSNGGAIVDFGRIDDRERYVRLCGRAAAEQWDAGQHLRRWRQGDHRPGRR